MGLDARSSRSPLGSDLTYRWTRVSGPPVALSGPYSSIATFTPVDFGDTAPRRYLFSLRTLDGTLAGHTVPVALDVVPVFEESRDVSIALLPGRNLIGIPVSPQSEGVAFDVAELARLTDSPFVAYPSEASGPGWRVWVPRFGTTAPVVTGTGAYLMSAPGSASRSLGLRGSPWSLESIGQHPIRRGMGLISLPGSARAGKTTDDLLAALNAFYLTTTAPCPGGRGRFVLIFRSSGGSPAAPLREGAGYIYSSGSAGARDLESLLASE